MDEAQRVRLLVDWNATAHVRPLGRCIHEIFSEQAALTPASVAIAHKQRQLTYEQLATRANQLARYLKSLGVGRRRWWECVSNARQKWW